MDILTNVIMVEREMMIFRKCDYGSLGFHLGRDKLRCAQHLPDLGAGHDFATEAEVDELDGPAGVVEKHHVFRLECKRLELRHHLRLKRSVTLRSK